jgi:DNA-binding response OmpR family regulator
VSAYHRPPTEFRALASGCDVFLKKPLEPRDLSVAIRALADQRRAATLN